MRNKIIKMDCNGDFWEFVTPYTIDIIKRVKSQAPYYHAILESMLGTVAHACNPSTLGGLGE